jgi:hypothetical protein
LAQRLSGWIVTERTGTAIFCRNVRKFFFPFFCCYHDGYLLIVLFLLAYFCIHLHALVASLLICFSWIDQIITFIEEVIIPEQSTTKKKVHIVGNSVGGHLAAYIAVRRPDLVESICLLNPTPVWGLNLPGWSGHLPAPFLPKAIGRFLFDRIRDLKTIEKFLEQTYSRREAFTEELVSCYNEFFLNFFFLYASLKDI